MNKKTGQRHPKHVISITSIKDKNAASLDAFVHRCEVDMS